MPQRTKTLQEKTLLKSRSWTGNAHARLIGESDDVRKTLRGTLSPDIHFDWFALVIAVCSLTIGLSVTLMAFWHSNTYRMLNQKEPDPKTFAAKDPNKIEGKLSAADVATISNQTCYKDKVGRYVIDADVTNTSDKTFDITLGCNLTLTGITADETEYSFTVSNVACDCASKNTYFSGTRIVVANIGPGQISHMTLYPRFDNVNIQNATITEVGTVELVLDHATKSEEELPRLDETAFSYTLAEDGSMLSIHAKTKPAKVDTRALLFEAMLTDKFQEPVGYAYTENIEFPFGITCVRGTISPHAQGQVGYGNIETRTSDVAVRATVTSIHE